MSDEIKLDDVTAEQKARDMLERMEIVDAQSFSAGDLVELANVIAQASAIAALKEQVATLEAALGDYANPKNWTMDDDRIARVWLEPDSDTPTCYAGFELANNALASQPAAPVAAEVPVQQPMIAVNLSNGSATEWNSAPPVQQTGDVLAQKEELALLCKIEDYMLITDHLGQAHSDCVAVENEIYAMVNGFIASRLAASGGVLAVPDGLREFVEAVAHHYSGVNNQEQLYCYGCNADLDDNEPHKPDCIVLRARAKLAAPAIPGADGGGK